MLERARLLGAAFRVAHLISAARPGVLPATHFRSQWPQADAGVRAPDGRSRRRPRRQPLQAARAPGRPLRLDRPALGRTFRVSGLGQRVLAPEAAHHQHHDHAEDSQHELRAMAMSDIDRGQDRIQLGAEWAGNSAVSFGSIAGSVAITSPAIQPSNAAPNHTRERRQY